MPRIAVVTPYYKESTDVLRQCHESVLSQDAGAVHFMVADGHPNEEVAGWAVRHVVLPTAHGDNGNTPRGVGSVLADAEGFDFIAYLDADNWFHPGHLRSLLDLHSRTRAPVCASFRTFHTLDGTEIKAVDTDEESGGHIDTSCLMMHRSAFSLVAHWARMPRQLSPICDRIFLAAIRHARFGVASTRQRTVAFRSQYEGHYRAAKLQPPPQAKANADLRPVMAYLSSHAGVTECVDRLGFWPRSFM